MIRAVPIRILRQVLLVVVGAEAFSRTEIRELSRHRQSTGRLSVDVDVDPAVDQTSVRSEQFPSLTRSGSCRRSASRKLIPSVEDGFRYACVKQSGKLCGGQRTAEQVALTFRTVPRLEKCELFLRFDALSDHALL